MTRKRYKISILKQGMFRDVRSNCVVVADGIEMRIACGRALALWVQCQFQLLVGLAVGPRSKG